VVVELRRLPLLFTAVRSDQCCLHHDIAPTGFTPPALVLITFFTDRKPCVVQINVYKLSGAERVRKDFGQFFGGQSHMKKITVFLLIVCALFVLLSIFRIPEA
jgi:hypothetical protein